MPEQTPADWLLEVELAMTSCTHMAAALNRAANTLDTLQPDELSLAELREYFRTLAGLYRRIADGQLQNFNALQNAVTVFTEQRRETERVKKALADL